MGGERAGGFEADAAVGAGDDERAAGEPGEVGGGPVNRRHGEDIITRLVRQRGAALLDPLAQDGFERLGARVERLILGLRPR